MRLKQVTITNFRCFRNEEISFSDYTAILGANNAGKSTILKAVDLFFRSSQRSHPFVLSDFCDPSKELRIALRFCDLPKAAAEEFAHYYRHNTLEFFIKATRSNSDIQASIHGTRLGIKRFGDFHKAGSANEKKEFYLSLREEYGDLPNIPSRSAVSVFEAALLEYENNNLGKGEMIESEDLAFGVSGIASRLRKYIDWVYIPAVKDAGDEVEEARNTAFGTLINRLIRANVKVDEKIAAIQAAAHDQITLLVDDYKEAVGKLEKNLDNEFRNLTSADAHVHLEWKSIGPENVTLNPPLIKSILSDSTFKGDITNFGHGLQRNYLMTLVHLNAKLTTETQPSIILACEEPELYQHPPQARHLHGVFQVMSKTDQVIVTTHSPYFVSAKSFESIRLARKSSSQLSQVSWWTVDEHRSLIAKARNSVAVEEEAQAAGLEVFIQPELSEVFFCGKLVLVEGLEDRAILVTALEHAEGLGDFVRCGGHIVGVNGKGNLINMIALARGFNIPHFVIFDADTDCDEKDIKGNKHQNRTVARALNLPEEECTWPGANVVNDRVVIWKDNIQAALASSYSDWHAEVQGVCEKWLGGGRWKKNPAVVSVALKNALERGATIPCVDEMVKRVLAFAKMP